MVNSLRSFSLEDEVKNLQDMISGMNLSIYFQHKVVFKPLLSHTGIQAQDATPLSYKMYFGEHLSFSGTLECLRADIVDSDTSKERKNKRSRR